MSLETIETAKTELIASIEKLVHEATNIVDDYWINFRMTNKKMREIEVKEGLAPGTKRGSFGPRVTVRTGKTYIEWVYYGPGRYGGKSKSWGDRVAPRKGPVYHLSQFSSKAKPWEFELITETELGLRPLRYSIEALHRAQAYISRLLSQMEASNKQVLLNNQLEKENDNE